MVDNERKTLRLLEDILRVIEKYDATTIKNAHLEVSSILDKESSTNSEYLANPNKSKTEVIGKMPFALLNKKYFPNANSLYDFANTLEIKIPAGNKSRNEIIGIIITGVADMNDLQMGKLRIALDKTFGRTKNGEVSTFIKEWEDVIKNLDIKH